jgi:hypothetical protein
LFGAAGTPDDAKGSPMDEMIKYLKALDYPYVQVVQRGQDVNISGIHARTTTPARGLSTIRRFQQRIAVIATVIPPLLLHKTECRSVRNA